MCHTSPTVLWDTAGSWMISPTRTLRTFPLTTSAEHVSAFCQWQYEYPYLEHRTFTDRPPAPKFQGDNFHKNRAIVDEIKKLAAQKGCTITQIALAWVASQGMIAIPGTTKASRLQENFSSRDVDLTEAEKKEMRSIIDAAKPHGNRYGAAHQAMVGH